LVLLFWLPVGSSRVHMQLPPGASYSFLLPDPTLILWPAALVSVSHWALWGQEGEALICSVVPFLWCKLSHHGGWQTIYRVTLGMKQGRDTRQYTV
jgi:hypothetical protein